MRYLTRLLAPLVCLLPLALAGCMDMAQAAEQPAPAQTVNGRGLGAVLIGLAQEGVHAPPKTEPQETQPQALPSPPEVTHPPFVPGPSPSPLPDARPESSIRFFTQRFCSGCIFGERQIDRFGEPAYAAWTHGDYQPGVKRFIHVVRLESHPEEFQKYRVATTPTYIKTVNGVEVDRRVGNTQSREQLIAWLNGTPEQTASRPREQWRSMLPRGTPADVSTDTEESISLPTTRINLAGQAIEFIDSRESRLNRWFSVVFRAGNIKHQGNSVVFSAPPEMRLHFTEGGAGVRLDSLKSIEFVPGGANLHLSIGVIPFRVKGR